MAARVAERRRVFVGIIRMVFFGGVEAFPDRRGGGRK
jgi:hypothetical protein